MRERVHCIQQGNQAEDSLTKVSFPTEEQVNWTGAEQHHMFGVTDSTLQSKNRKEDTCHQK